MNTLSFRDLCCLLCCPPLPSRIAAKLAFLPPQPTYSIVAVDSTAATNTTDQSQTGPNVKYKIVFSDKAEWHHSLHDFNELEPFFVRTSRRHRIACLHIHSCSDPKFYILFSHGNAVDLGQMANFLIVLGARLKCDIITYDYSGYGVSEGKASEKNIYADIEAVYQSMKKRLNLDESKIILYGQSIGTVPTIDLASRHKNSCIACILHSPLASGMRVAFPDTKRTWCFDPFPSIEKVHRIRSIVLIIHGTDDQVIDVSHGFALYNRLSIENQLEPLWIEGAGHNDIELRGQYIQRLLKLIYQDIPKIDTKVRTEKDIDLIITSVPLTEPESSPHEKEQ